MTNTSTLTKVAAWVGLVLGVLSVFGSLLGSGSASFGNTYAARAPQVFINPTDWSGGLQVGSQSAASLRTLVRDNTCNAYTATASFAATTTAAFYCVDTNVVAGDIIDVRLPQGASSGATYGTFVVPSGSGFATTSGAGFGFYMMNLTGAATSSYTLATTSVSYSVVRTK